MTFIGVRDLPLRDMISLGAWRMGLGCPGKILPSSPSPPPSPTQGWGGGKNSAFPPEIKSCARRGAWFDFLTFSSKSQEFGFSPEIKSQKCASSAFLWFDFLNFTHEYISEISWIYPRFHEKCFLSWIGSKSELPTSKYATSARNFDPHPMENLPDPQTKTEMHNNPSLLSP